MLHHDNARPHTSLMTHRKLLGLGWNVLPHPVYLPDFATSDFHLIYSVHSSLYGITFHFGEAMKQHPTHFLPWMTNEHRILQFTSRSVDKRLSNKMVSISSNCSSILSWHNIFFQCCSKVITFLTTLYFIKALSISIVATFMKYMIFYYFLSS